VDLPDVADRVAYWKLGDLHVKLLVDRPIALVLLQHHVHRSFIEELQHLGWCVCNEDSECGGLLGKLHEGDLEALLIRCAQVLNALVVDRMTTSHECSQKVAKLLFYLS